MPYPSYDEFVQHESHLIRAAYKKRNNFDSLNESDIFHQAWRRLDERWSFRDMVHDILNEPLEDGGAGGDKSSSTQKKEKGFIRTNGIDFIDEDGKPWLFAGYTTHTLLNKVTKGEDITPILNEALGYGANILVVIGCHLSQWKKDNGFFLNPLDIGHQSNIAKLFDICDSNGIRVCYRALSDAQALSTQQKVNIWNQACEVAKGHWNVFMTIGNESNMNGWSEIYFSKHDLGGVLQSKGSQGGEILPYKPYWDFAEYEVRRDLPKGLIDAGGGMIELQHGGWDKNKDGYQCPLVSIEPIFFHNTTVDMWGDKRNNDPKIALKLGVNTSANCAGGAFGSSESLICLPNGPIAAECAKEYFRGMWAGFVR